MRAVQARICIDSVLVALRFTRMLLMVRDTQHR